METFFNPSSEIAKYGKHPKARSHEEIEEIKAAAVPWPPGAQQNGTYVVPKEYSVWNFDYVYLPAGFVMVLADDCPGLNWTINVLEFGTNAILDLSVQTPGAAPGQSHPPIPTAIPPVAANLPPAGDYAHGSNGLLGAAGAPGYSGKPLQFTVQNLVMTGSLWIRTDGGTGGEGGPGQQGGNNPNCNGEGTSNGGDGGTGGQGGPGGQGGATSTVAILINSMPVGYSFSPVACTNNGGYGSPPPATLNGNDGRIVIWGAPGLGGYPKRQMHPPIPKYVGGGGGSGGRGGGATIQCYSFPFTNYYGSPGRNGVDGPEGPAGAVGACSPASIKGPAA